MELPENEVILSPTDHLTTPACTEDDFSGYSFSQTLSDTPVTQPTQQSTESHSIWNLLPVVSIRLVLACYARNRSLELIRILLSSRYLDKQQRFVIQNIILSSPMNKITDIPRFNNIIFRHLFATVLVLTVSLLDLYIFLIAVTVFVFYLLSQIRKLFLVFSIKRAFTRVVTEFSAFEDILGELSVALKLLTQIKIVQKATFHMQTISPLNCKNVNNLKIYLTNLYSDIFFQLQQRTLSFPLADIPINQEELICTLEAENIFYKVYDESLEGIQGLCVSKMSLDSLKLWHCLLTCQYGEYIEILVQLINRNLQLDEENWTLQQLEVLKKVGLIETSFYSSTLNSLSQSISLAKLDLFSLNLKDIGSQSKDFSPKGNTRQDTLDKIDLILQSCILKVRNLKESNCNNSYSENELMSLKFCVENTLDGIETIRKLSSTNANQTSITNSESEVTFPDNSTENGVIIPSINPLEIPQSEEIVFEGFSLENSDIKSEIFREKEEYIETGASQTVLNELKCVLAGKNILKDQIDIRTPSRDKQISNNNSIPASLLTTEPNAGYIPANSAQSLLNIAILSSNRSKKLAQTVIGDTSDSD